MTAAPTDIPPEDAPETAATTSTAPAPDETHPLAPDGSQVWDGAAWVAVDADSLITSDATTDAQPAKASPPVPPEEHPISADGHWRWDGSAWQAIEASTPEQSGTRLLSADGKWSWDGSAWQPVEVEAAKSAAPDDLDPGVKALIASGMPVSDDGHWVWNGQGWQTTGR
jgi:hypothetical protein